MTVTSYYDSDGKFYVFQTSYKVYTKVFFIIDSYGVLKNFLMIFYEFLLSLKT